MTDESQARDRSGGSGTDGLPDGIPTDGAPETPPAGDDRDLLGGQFDALRDPLRRCLLARLAEAGDAAELPIGADLARTTRVALYHAHLPKLAAAEYVEWDDSPLVVRRGPAFDEIEPLLGLLEDHQDEFHGEWPSSDASLCPDR